MEQHHGREKQGGRRKSVEGRKKEEGRSQILFYSNVIFCALTSRMVCSSVASPHRIRSLSTVNLFEH